jgi:hypothetical protein
MHLLSNFSKMRLLQKKLLQKTVSPFAGERGEEGRKPLSPAWSKGGLLFFSLSWRRVFFG